jgi:hypothetical protein
MPGSIDPVGDTRIAMRNHPTNSTVVVAIGLKTIEA